MWTTIWTLTKRALSALDSTLSYALPVIFIGLGCLMLYASVFERLPAPREMTPVSGYVQYYRVERSRGDIPSRINFKLWNDDTPYWTNEIDDVWVSGKLDGAELAIAFHIEPGPIFRAGFVKTFGLTVNGRVIAKLEDDLKSETIILRYGFPVLALLMLLFAAWKWPRKPQLVLQPDGTTAAPRVDKGFALSWERLSPRRQFIRSCWGSGLVVIFVLLVKPQALWILGAIVLCSLWVWQSYRAWRDDTAH